MFPRLAFLLSFVLLALLGAVLIACGGSNNGGGGGGGGPYNVVGNWQANFSAPVGATTTGYGAIDSAGLAAFLDTSGNIVKMPTLTGATTFSGNLTAYAVNGTFFSDGTTVMTDAGTGKTNSAASISGSFTGSVNAGTFTLAAYSPVNSVTPVSGAMQGKVIGFIDTLLLNFNPDGTFTGTDQSPPSNVCTVNGKLTQQGTSNVFDVTYNTVSGNCLASTNTGIAFESKSDYLNVNGGTAAFYLNVILLTSTLPQVSPGVLVIYQ